MLKVTFPKYTHNKKEVKKKKVKRYVEYQEKE